VELPLDKVELVLEVFGLLVILAVSFHFAKQPPVGEGCDAVMQGKIGGSKALEKPLEPSRHRLGIVHGARS